MPAPNDTKLQVNFSLDDRTLVNIYVAEPLDLPKLLGIIADTAGDIASTRQILNAAGVAATIVTAAPPVATAQPVAAPVAAPAPVVEPQAGAGPACQHGPMTWRQGVGKATNKPYKGWFCPSPDRASQCQPQFA